MLRPATPGWGPLLCGGGWPLATPGCGAWLRGPASPGWGPPPGAVVRPSPLLAEGRGRSSPPLLAGVYWLWWWGPWVPFTLVLVCVCVLCGASCWCGWRWGVVRGVAAVCVRVCACGVWLVGCVIPWLVLVVGRHGRGQKAEEKQYKRSCRYIPLYLSHRAFFPL